MISNGMTEHAESMHDMNENKDAHNAYKEPHHSHEEKHYKEESHLGMYSLPDITHKLHEEFEDEISGANQYLDMANSAAHMNHHDLATALTMMAKDEYSHARFIHSFLKESGIAISDEICEQWKDVDNRFQRLFCQEEYY